MGGIKLETMKFKKITDYVEHLKKTKSGADIQRVRGKRPFDSARDIRSLKKQAEKIDLFLAQFGVSLSLEQLENEKTFPTNSAPDGLYCMEQAEKMINDTFAFEGLKNHILQMQYFVSQHKSQGNTVKALYDVESFSVKLFI